MSKYLLPQFSCLSLSERQEKAIKSLAYSTAPCMLYEYVAGLLEYDCGIDDDKRFELRQIALTLSGGSSKYIKDFGTDQFVSIQQFTFIDDVWKFATERNFTIRPNGSWSIQSFTTVNSKLKYGLNGDLISSEVQDNHQMYSTGKYKIGRSQK